MKQTNNTPVRPVRVPPTHVDRLLELAALFLFVFIWMAVLHFWKNAPAEVPTGFQADGSPRGWGNPAFMYGLLLIVSTLVWVLATLSYRYPALISLPVTLKEETVIAQSALMMRSVRWTNLLTMLLLAGITAYTAGFQYGVSEDARLAFVILSASSVAGLFFVLFYYTIKISKVKP